ncbi:MAG: hypothetical protein NT066_06225, partial [Candidatus Omnitrophica bacterium]|nr:hypothetical protein [Candidatus Omnitrophota bacterium]
SLDLKRFPFVDHTEMFYFSPDREFHRKLRGILTEIGIEVQDSRNILISLNPPLLSIRALTEGKEQGIIGMAELVDRQTQAALNEALCRQLSDRLATLGLGGAASPISATEGFKRTSSPIREQDSDPSRTNRPLTLKEQAGLEEIRNNYVNKHTDEILALREIGSATQLKQRVAGTLREKGYKNIAEILENSLVVRAPPGLIKAIEEFEQKHKVIVYAINLPANLSPIKGQSAIILINPEEKELAPSLIRESGVLSGLSDKESRELEEKVGILPEFYPKPIRQDRSEKEIRFDAYADTLYRLERQTRLAYQEALQAFIDRLIELSTQIGAPELTDELSQLPKALQSGKLRSKIRAFENRVKKAHRARDDVRLTELNRKIVELLKSRLKIQLQLAAAWLEVAKSDRRRLIAAINSIRGARSTSKRISAEYGWQRRRETKTILVEKLRAVGYYGMVIETFLYKDLDIKVYAPDKEHPQGKVTIRQQRWVTLTLADGTKVKERQWRDIPYEDWPTALRSQIHTLTSQEIDYETILHYLADLDYCHERLSEYRKSLPEYIHQQIEESLINSFIWTKKGSVAGKRAASKNLEFALAKLKEDAFVVVLKELENAIKNLGARLQEIEEIRKGVDRRLESVYVYIRNSDIKEKLTLLKEKLNLGKLEEAGDLASLLYQNYFTAIAKEAGYNYLQKYIAAISNAIDNLKKLFQQGKSISDELTLRKRSHNDMQDQINPFKRERDKLEKRKKGGLLDDIGKVRLSELESIIRPLEEKVKNNY